SEKYQSRKRSKQMEEKYPEKTLANETSEVKEVESNKKENEKLDPSKEKLKRHYQSQDKLDPLFDDPKQSIDTYKMINNQQKRKSEEDEKFDDYKEDKKNKEENEKWPKSLDYSLIYGNQTENIELQDIWNDKQNEPKIRQISIRGKAGSGKSMLSQRI
ncbi:hypothetical protein RFI_32317, partial [Reticulomyxa filosa]